MVRHYTFDTAVYNMRYKCWVAEGRKLTERQAKARVVARRRTSPAATFKIIRNAQ